MKLPIFCIEPSLMTLNECIKEINRIEKHKPYSKKLDERQNLCFERISQIKKSDF